jgi:hypothetical protein
MRRDRKIYFYLFSSSVNLYDLFVIIMKHTLQIRVIKNSVKTIECEEQKFKR